MAWGANPSLAGIGVTTRCVMDGEASAWLDASYGIIGSNRPDKVELYAIGLALEIAVGELQSISDRLYRLGSHSEVEATTVLIMTDSQASLYFIHDYTLNGKTPPMFARETFIKLMQPMTKLKELRALISFQWVPGHTNIEGNSRADCLAGKASKWTSERCGRRRYQTSLDCEVIEIRDLTDRRILRIPKNIPTKCTKATLPDSKVLKGAFRANLAGQIEGMQAEWVADVISESYRPNDSKSVPGRGFGREREAHQQKRDSNIGYDQR